MLHVANDFRLNRVAWSATSSSRPARGMDHGEEGGPVHRRRPHVQRPRLRERPRSKDRHGQEGNRQIAAPELRTRHSQERHARSDATGEHEVDRFRTSKQPSGSVRRGRPVSLAPDLSRRAPWNSGSMVPERHSIFY